MRSMTGFGCASGVVRGSLVSLEINSVNHRSLELSVRIPSLWGPLESFIRDKVRQNINRGKVYIWIRRQATEITEPIFTFNENIVKRIHQTYRKIETIITYTGRNFSGYCHSTPGVFETTISDEEIEQIKKEIEPLFDLAIKSL
jgi:uncharacterized protein (TIGR00255 family)